MIKWLERKLEDGIAVILNKIDPIDNEVSRKNRQKGTELEKRVVKDLESVGLKVLHSCYIPTNGGYTEIDVIAVGRKGVYVFELKNYTGNVVITDTDNWVVYYGENKYNLYNPVKQNEGHIKWLNTYLNRMGVDYFHNIVVLPNEAVIFNREKHTNVILELELVEYLKKVSYKYNLDEKAIDKVYSRIKPTTEVSNLVKRNQIKNAKKYATRGGSSKTLEMKKKR